jgi:hypothetical protein
MKLSRFSKIWLLILGAGLLSGTLGVAEYGLGRGDSIGLAIGLAWWLVLAFCVGVVIWRENKLRN